jgi:hypothetical protein
MMHTFNIDGSRLVLELDNETPTKGRLLLDGVPLKYNLGIQELRLIRNTLDNIIYRCNYIWPEYFSQIHIRTQEEKELINKLADNEAAMEELQATLFHLIEKQIALGTELTKLEEQCN